MFLDLSSARMNVEYHNPSVLWRKCFKTDKLLFICNDVIKIIHFKTVHILFLEIIWEETFKNLSVNKGRIQ